MNSKARLSVLAPEFTLYHRTAPNPGICVVECYVHRADEASTAVASVIGGGPIEFGRRTVTFVHHTHHFRWEAERYLCGKTVTTRSGRELSCKDDPILYGERTTFYKLYLVKS